MRARPRKQAKKQKPLKLTRAQLKKIKGGSMNAHPLCDASPKGSGHDCGAASIVYPI